MTVSKRPSFFPYPYPIKVLGRYTPDFQTLILTLVKQHAVIVDEHTVTLRPSREKHFCSLSLTIMATSRAQLDTLHQALVATDLVKMVL